MQIHKKGKAHYQIIMDVRSTVIGNDASGKPVTLAAYYQAVNSDDAVDQIRDAVRQLVQARSNQKEMSKGGQYIEVRKVSLAAAFEKSRQWLNSDLEQGFTLDGAVEAIDDRILQSIANREINAIAYGRS
jgi:hypothetical protein